MKFDDLVKSFGSRAWFDDTSVALLFDEDHRTVHSELSRLKKAGKVIQLRKGLYTLAEHYRKAQLHSPAIAQALYAPSYLSERWALSWYGVIPEKTVALTSVSTRATRSFENAFGSFRYRTVKNSMFFGFRKESIQGIPVPVAGPEKALVDLWYLESGDWTMERMEAMRLDPGAGIDEASLAAIVLRTKEARLARILKTWKLYAGDIRDGGLAL